MIDIKTLAPGIKIELRYATTHNFTGRILYPDSSQCLLCKPAAHRLARVQKKLEKEGLGLKIWDCYRPLSVQKKLWDVVPDANYVANPLTGSKHNRGASIDLTLVDREGNELPMPTEFDEFSEKAHRNYMDLPPEVLKNRQKLESAMQSEGFIGIPKEWWHFDDPEWVNYSLRDEPIGQPGLLTDRPNSIVSFHLPESCHQAIAITAAEWKSTTGELILYKKSSDHWTEEKKWPINFGMKGLLWGNGLHPNELLVQTKKESDLTTPAGVFKVGKSYGYQTFHPAKNWDYQPIDSSWKCVDDPQSQYYNTVFSVNDSIKKDWQSAEEMKRNDDLYRYVINIEQNFPTVKKGCGSCIFFHVWRKDGSPTEGCISMSEDNMVTLLNWLDPKENPTTVILPAFLYKALKQHWKLP